MIHFHPLRIKEIRKETEECVSILFDIPDEIKSQFTFKQGQSLTMRTHLQGEEVRRTYSICSSPLDNEWRVAIKKVPGGLFSSHANDGLKEGDLLEVMPPVGKFYTDLDRSHQKDYLAVAAGSGITPVLSLIKTTLLTEPKSSFTLVYGNRTRSSIIFKEELDALKNKYMDRFVIHHVLSREITDVPVYNGRVNREKCEVLFNKLIDLSNMDECFICGPEEMMFSVKVLLEEKGIDKKHIHFELFNTPVQKQLSPMLAGDSLPGHKTGSKSKPGTEETNSKISVKLDGVFFDFELAQSGETILDAALKQGADLPFACKGGVCCTCRAKLVKGEVEMEVNYGLEQDEIEAGFILTCQSHPTTKEVMLDFDIR